MINQNNTEYNGPLLGGIKIRPTYYTADGGTSGTTPLPAIGYHSSSVIPQHLYNNGYPNLGNNIGTNTGEHIYEPARIPFVHKFGGPSWAVTGDVLGGSFDTNSNWFKEEFLRIKLPKGTNTMCPYTCATLTGIIFPYGKTNQGPISPLGNRTGTSLFRYKFNFVRTRPPNHYAVDLHTYDPIPSNFPQSAPGKYAPLYSSSLVNLYHHNQSKQREFEISTDPSVVDNSYGSQTCIRGQINVLSFTPEVSEGNCENFNLPANFPQQTGDPVLGGITPFILEGSVDSNVNPVNIGTANNIYLRLQGKTDGDDASFVCIAKRGSIIKGIIELF